MAVSSAPLPPAVEAAHRILADRGPASASRLKDDLRLAGFSLAIDRLAQLPDRFPNRFQLTANGLLSVACSDHDPGDEDLLEDPPSPDWYRPNERRAELDRVAVLDIETTGLDPTKDLIWEITLDIPGAELSSDCWHAVCPGCVFVVEGVVV